MNGEPRTGREIWADAVLAAKLFARDRSGLGGVVLRARPGPVRERWFEALRRALPPDVALRRMPAQVREDRLLGGLDLAATLATGAPAMERGLLAEAHGHVLVAAMAERLDAGVAATIAAALDDGVVVVERDGVSARAPAAFGLVAIDESLADEDRVAACLRERLAFHIDLDAVGMADIGDNGGTDGAVPEHAQTSAPDGEALRALCEAAFAFGVDSLRAPCLALRAARASAALARAAGIRAEDIANAARLVIGPRATMVPAAEDEAGQPDAPPDEADDESSADPPSPDEQSQAPPDAQELKDLVLDAIASALPAELLKSLQGQRAPSSPTRGSGRAGELAKAGARGRPIGVRRGDLRRGERLGLIDTLRAAAPWQRLRRAQDQSPKPPLPASCGESEVSPPRIHVRPEDFRVKRFKAPRQTTTIFVVDASGSAALHRMAEAKGAVESLLADCYVRRDHVALVSFRGRGAEILLPPTRSLARAKRSLAGLPCGGGTPLAAGIETALRLALDARRRARTPTLVVLTDGRANVARDGQTGRVRAGEDALAIARLVRAQQIPALLVDTSPRPHPMAEQLTAEMRGKYLLLPMANSTQLSAAVRSNLAA